MGILLLCWQKINHWKTTKVLLKFKMFQQIPWLQDSSNCSTPLGGKFILMGGGGKTGINPNIYQQESEKTTYAIVIQYNIAQWKWISCKYICKNIISNNTGFTKKIRRLHSTFLKHKSKQKHSICALEIHSYVVNYSKKEMINIKCSKVVEEEN